MGLSSINLSPLNGYVKMSPYGTGDLCIEPERIATSGNDFVLREGGPSVSPSFVPGKPHNKCRNLSLSKIQGGNGLVQRCRQGNSEN